MIRVARFSDPGASMSSADNSTAYFPVDHPITQAIAPAHTQAAEGQTRFDPVPNYQGFAAVCGGTQSLHTNGFDEALALPTEHSAQVAVRTQQILAHEAGCTDTADPLGGSFFIESLTAELEERARELIAQVDELGGAVTAIEQGFVQAEIEDAAFTYSREIESAERVIVGVNRFAVEGDESDVEIHRLDPEAERRQLERTSRVRAERDQAAAAAALAAVREAARGTVNLLPPMRTALAAHCTIGEVCDALREVFGTYPARAASS
jgi:methylmalonyl-CoA mutase N-terminal domain/subunit